MPENIAQQRAPQAMGHAYFQYRTYTSRDHRRSGFARALLTFNFTHLADYFSAQQSPASQVF